MIHYRQGKKARDRAPYLVPDPEMYRGMHHPLRQTKHNRSSIRLSVSRGRVVLRVP